MGFRSKNQTTIVNQTSILCTFGIGHLSGATNISSPLISVYDSYEQAEKIALYFATKYEEETWVVKIDTRHLARGPVFRAADLLAEKEAAGELTEVDRELHKGEYLIMYKIPPQAVRDETRIGVAGQQRWRAVGAVGSPVGV
jgi:hypothetical protein